MTMSKSESHEFVRHSIVRIENPDGNLSAQEMKVHRTIDGKIIVTPVPMTVRSLPLGNEEAWEWVNDIPGDMPEEVKEDLIKMLCCDDLKHND
jgi:hypothetical protein